jgi:hypothetical protein
MNSFEDEIDVFGKVYEMKWNAEFIPAFKFDGYNRANEEGYEIDVASIRHSFFGTWHELPVVTEEAHEIMMEEMMKIMRDSLCE